MQKLIVLYLVALASVGCTVVPTKTTTQACNLLEIAGNEADLAPSWYTSAAVILDQCGEPEAIEVGHMRMCAAMDRNGYQGAPLCADYEAELKRYK